MTGRAAPNGPGPGPLTVAIIGPAGTLLRSVRCSDGEQVIRVVERESEGAERYTMFVVTRQGPGGEEPVARWAVGSRGLVRAPYRHNAGERMDELMLAARRAYAHGRLEGKELERYLVDEYGASADEASLAAVAGRLAVPSEYEGVGFEPNRPPVRKRYRGWAVDLWTDERGYWHASYEQPKKTAAGWRKRFYRRSVEAGRGLTSAEVLERAKRGIDRLEGLNGPAYGTNPEQRERPCLNELAKRIREIDEKRRPLSRRVNRDPDAIDEQGRSVMERLMELEDERNRLAGVYRAELTSPTRAGTKVPT